MTTQPQPAEAPPARLSAEQIGQMVALCKDERSDEWRDPLHNAYLRHVPLLVTEINALRAERDLSYRQADELNGLYKDLQSRSQGWIAAERERADRAERAAADPGPESC